MNKNINLILFFIIFLQSYSLEMISPPKLNWGDTIMIIAPGTNASIDKLEKIEKNLKTLGFKVKFGKSCFINYGYLAGNDKLRLKDLHSAFLDDEVKAIIALRGGYGSIRLLDMIDYDMIRRHPKIFVGYSDITILHIALNQKAGLITYHGPMAASDFYYGLDKFTHNSFFNTILKGRKKVKIKNPEGEEMKTLVSGQTVGQVVGGNLTMIVATLGTPYEINTKDKIFFIEESGSKLYKIDRMLNQLKLAGKFKDAKGVIFGDFKETHEEDTLFKLKEVLKIAINGKKPIIYNVKIGHSKPKITFPLGAKIYLDSEKKIIKIIDDI
ncbi:muramoyltetrapeptide carboxypeptidase [Hypnocyclicus thermotrophus]|uniref:Muramoyltetrapeptide carboxypeptidase n=1 Tax=Hypnocyclicus thermotrophus TaxID=1627895 RepID=A0AA46E0F3_9FUSO|nr:LD-carboxypeptidase [Hypnocyclicus thermotrophus]TDT72021.1 muramoyltetrapeptide carboxypeptidase [Hypnocyclicus thermotrophus]